MLVVYLVLRVGCGGLICDCGGSIVAFLILIVVDFDLPDLVVSLWRCYGFLVWFGLRICLELLVFVILWFGFDYWFNGGGCNLLMLGFGCFAIVFLC